MVPKTQNPNIWVSRSGTRCTYSSGSMESVKPRPRTLGPGGTMLKSQSLATKFSTHPCDKSRSRYPSLALSDVFYLSRERCPPTPPLIEERWLDCVMYGLGNCGPSCLPERPFSGQAPNPDRMKMTRGAEYRHVVADHVSAL